MALLGAGCPQGAGSLVGEEDDPAFRRGRQLLRQDRKPEALEAFLAVIDARPVAPESHFEAAELFLTHLRDPIRAIYHYQRYLEHRGGSDKAPQVLQRIETAKKEFARSLPGDPFRSDVERLELQTRLEQLQAENDQLKRELGELRSFAARSPGPVRSATPVPAGELTEEPRPALVAATQPDPRAAAGAAPTGGTTRVGSTYVVRPGDTLYKISASVYGTPSRWRDIFEANKDRLRNPQDLRVGAELRLPQ